MWILEYREAIRSDRSIGIGHWCQFRISAQPVTSSNHCLLTPASTGRLTHDLRRDVFRLGLVAFDAFDRPSRLRRPCPSARLSVSRLSSYSGTVTVLSGTPACRNPGYRHRECRSRDHTSSCHLYSAGGNVCGIACDSCGDDAYAPVRPWRAPRHQARVRASARSRSRRSPIQRIRPLPTRCSCAASEATRFPDLRNSSPSCYRAAIEMRMAAEGDGG